ncbi:MAG TPA: PilZ domain-containing protein [Candidatus Acidoferrum sp.]|nr:PilZ domain-containing protein [Candidatus Acidoferrum sp.]
MSTPNIRPTQTASQRRSQRILLSVPLRVSGKRANGTAFVEHTKTLIVSAHGALLQLQEAVQNGQPLMIRNVTTGEEMPCKVVDLNPGANGVAEVGVEFSQPNPRFWRVSFPPADWSARSPEAKRFAASPIVSPPKAKDPVVKK